MFMTERHNQIVEILTEKKTATVAELSELLNVSPVTVRNDLNHLAEQRRVVRTHGGASIADERVRQEYTFATRQRLRSAQKQRIGELAADLIQPVESILLDASTTALAVGQAIKRRPELTDLTIVATGVWTALEMLGSPGLTIILAGGILRDTTGSITGSMAQDMLTKINLHKAFLGAWGVTIEEGLTDTHLQEVELKQAIIERCQEVIAVVDGSKFGQVALASFAPIDKISRIVTDDSAPPDLVRALRERGIDVLIA